MAKEEQGAPGKSRERRKRKGELRKSQEHLAGAPTGPRAPPGFPHLARPGAQECLIHLAMTWCSVEMKTHKTSSLTCFLPSSSGRGPLPVSEELAVATSGPAYPRLVPGGLGAASGGQDAGLGRLRPITHRPAE